MDMMKLFTALLIVQLFYGFGITATTYALPSAAQNHISGFSDIGDGLDLQTIGEDVEQSLESQTNIPVIDIGALVFYSGNILIDLILNFVLAIPSMITLLVHGLGQLINADARLMLDLKNFIGIFVTILYVLGVMQLLVGIRSGRSVA